MAVSRVEVRDYTYVLSDSRTRRVQCPHLDLQNIQPPFFVRPVEGSLLHETLIVHEASGLCDDIWELPYEVDAQGVVAKLGARSHLHPVWIVRKTFRFEEPFLMDLVDLISYEQFQLPCSHVCWVPQLETHDGTLVTPINEAPEHFSGQLWQYMVLQTPGVPAETKLVRKNVDTLSGLKNIDGPRKQTLFELQLAAYGTNMRVPANAPSPEPMVGSPKPSPVVLDDSEQSITGSVNHGRHHRVDVPMDDSGSSVSDWSSTDDDIATPMGSGVDDSTYDDVIEVHRSPSPYDGCKYPGLAPSYTNTRPRHRHNEDHDCPLGSNHQKHCIFPDWCRDKCVISGEPHEHCPPLTPPCVTSPSTVSFTQDKVDNHAEMSSNTYIESDPRLARNTASQIPDNDSDDLSYPLVLVHGLEALSPLLDVPMDCSPEFAPQSPMPPLTFTSNIGTPLPTFFGSDGMDLEGSELMGPEIVASSRLWEPEVHLSAMVSTPEPPELHY